MSQNVDWATVGFVNYSTEEKQIGTWIDGKPIYRKVVNMTTAPSTSTYVPLPGISNVETIINIHGELNVNDREARSIPLATPENNMGMVWFGLDKATQKIQVAHNVSNANSRNLIVVVEYTKTTD